MNREEQALQRTVVEYLRLKYPEGRSPVLWFHVPNQLAGAGGKTPEARKRRGGMLWAMGVRAGVGDLTFNWTSYLYEDLDVYPPFVGYIELKVDDRKPTESQRAFKADAGRAGAKYAICRSLDEVIQTLENWGCRDD